MNLESVLPQRRGLLRFRLADISRQGGIEGFLRLLQITPGILEVSQPARVSMFLANGLRQLAPQP